MYVDLRVSLLLIAITFFQCCYTAIVPKVCKVNAASPLWPSLEQWNDLNSTIHGRLLKPAPTAAVCHPEQPSYNLTVCLTTDWTDATTYVNDPIGILNPNWNDDSCLPSPKYPCTGAGSPIYVINASGAGHVLAGINFARKHSVRLNVKGSGHDYLGR